jgi:hypothetical protein
MPSLPPRDGVDAPICAGIRTGTSTISPVDSLSSVAGKSSPHHKQGSTTPWAAPPAPLARADPPEYGDPPGRSVGLMAPLPLSFGASMPSYSPHSSVPFRSMGGEYTPTACTTPPLDEATRHSRLTSMARPPLPACLTKTTSPQRTLSLLSPSYPSLPRGGASLAKH